MLGKIEIRLKTNAADRDVLCDVQKRVYVSEVAAKSDEELQRTVSLQLEPGTKKYYYNVGTTGVRLRKKKGSAYWRLAALRWTQLVSKPGLRPREKKVPS